MSRSNDLHCLDSIPEELESEDTEGWLNSGRLSCPCDGVAGLPIRDAVIGCSNGVTSTPQTLHGIRGRGNNVVEETKSEQKAP